MIILDFFRENRTGNILEANLGYKYDPPPNMEIEMPLPMNIEIKIKGHFKRCITQSPTLDMFKKNLADQIDYEKKHGKRE